MSRIGSLMPADLSYVVLTIQSGVASMLHSMHMLQGSTGHGEVKSSNDCVLAWLHHVTVSDGG